MNYIVFDLEWNQCPEGKSHMDKALPFEIIEIGAVKLNNEMQVIDEFNRIIKPQVYKSIHHRTEEIIHLDVHDLDNGESFPIVAERFMKWCGTEVSFCTWGSLDLTEFQRNLKFFHLEHLLVGPIYFYDVQKIFSIRYEDTKTRRSLEYAVDFLKIDKAEEFHRAYADSYYTAMVMKHLPGEYLTKNYSIDYYNNPKSRNEEIYVKYEKYSKYISREFDSKELAMEDRQVVSTKCFLCNTNARKKSRWFSANNNIYYSIAYCRSHGYLKGKLRMKKTDDGKVYCVKTIKLINLAEVQRIIDKKKMIQLKRKIKRQGEVQ